jgi:hypothetical protein
LFVGTGDYVSFEINHFEVAAFGSVQFWYVHPTAPHSTGTASHSTETE